VPTVEGEESLIICIGDSITFGSGIRNAARNFSSYPARLQTLLDNVDGAGKWNVKNLGFRGATATNKSRLSYEKSPFFTRLLNSSPKVAIIMLGTNDIMLNISLSTFADDYKSLISAVTQLDSKPQVLIMTPPWIDTKFPTRAERFKNIVQEPYHKVIQTLALETRATLLNGFSIFANKTHLFADGLHPNEEGYNLIAKLVVQGLESLRLLHSSTSAKGKPVKEPSVSALPRSVPKEDTNKGISLETKPFLGRQAHFNTKGRDSDQKVTKRSSSWFW
jgi:lysophospholipase L1-like esterase